jgi:A/G-specific adenine glycosylase
VPSKLNLPFSETGSAIKFCSSLLKWNKTKNFRHMPWKGEKDPYKIWLSEIILQQTRVEQGLKYYERFLTAFPTVKHLATAPEQKIFKLWEGLGYYNRCRNLIYTSKIVHNNYKGVFPTSYEEILSLKGIGEYTAAAIASFAYNLPFAVLDGNVYRVLSRIHGITTPTDSKEGKEIFSRLAETHLPKNKAGDYNQAIMDFGATVCKPVPDCNRCFFKKNCIAFQKNLQLKLPVKNKKLQKKDRWFHYFIMEKNDSVAIIKRLENDIWQNLYQFPMLEAPSYLLKTKCIEDLGINLIEKRKIWCSSQKLTHQQIHFSFYKASLNEKVAIEEYQWVKKKDLHDYAFPRTLKLYIDEYIQ